MAQEQGRNAPAAVAYPYPYTQYPPSQAHAHPHPHPHPYPSTGFQQHPQPLPTPTPRTSSGCCPRSTFRKFCIVAGITAFIASIIVAILVVIFVVLRPTPPEVYVESAQLITFALKSSSSLRYHLKTELSFRNPNTHSYFVYRSPKVEGCYGKSSFGETQLQTFRQNYNVTMLKEIEMEGQTAIERGGTTAELFNAQELDGSFDLGLKIHGRMDYKYSKGSTNLEYNYILKLKANCWLPALPLDHYDHYGHDQFARTKCKVKLSF